MNASFPIDILAPILNNLSSYSDFACISLLCKAANVEAERYLYRQWPPTTAYDNPANFPRVMERHANFLSSIMQNERQAGLVQSYAPPSLKPNDIEFWRIVQEALGKMKNLKTLRFSHLSSKIDLNLFQDVSAQLDRFEVAWTLKGRRLEDILIPFLVSQPKLRRLHVQAILKTSLPKGACPELEYLSGSASAINSILPGRAKLKQLVWPTYETEMSKRTHQFVQENITILENLEYLAFRTGETELHRDLQLFAPTLLNVKTLIFRHLPDQSSLSLLSTLPDLVRVIIYAVNLDSITRESLTITLSALFKYAKSLVYVDVCFQPRKNFVGYQEGSLPQRAAIRWLHGRMQPGTVVLKATDEYLHYSEVVEGRF